MYKLYGGAFLIALTVSCLSATTKHAQHFAALPLSVELGAYDNYHRLDDVTTISVEQIWPVSGWDQYKLGGLLVQLKAIGAKGRKPMVVIEPYPVEAIGNESTLLPDITAGRYDKLASAIAKEIASFGSPVFVRWGPEMECLQWKPWSAKPAADYIAAYRRVATIFRHLSPNSILVWSPVGNIGCEAYYPGDDVVDYTGFSLYELPAASITWVGHSRSFVEWMNEKYPRFVGFHKPTILTEVGIDDTPEKQKAWMEAAFTSLPNYPTVKLIVYFNTQDLVSWQKWGGTGAPNWLIDPSVFTNK
jgi:beta-mannanase